VLFADVTDFTKLAEALDPEDLRALQNAIFETFGRAVTRYDGFVEKFVGDAVMAVFGAPDAHEDDPERALHAALALLDGSAQLSKLWEPRLGKSLNLHIGIHTGPVVAGSFSNAAGVSYAVTGDTVNTTARLLAVASNSILVSDATHALTRHRFAFEQTREMTLRGKSAPIVVHRLLGTLAEPRSSRGLAAHGMVAPMIGRSEELGRLLAAFENMLREQAQLACLIAEAGMGKSRLIAAFLKRLESDGRLSSITVRQTACSSLTEPTYGIFASLLREAYRVEDDDPLNVARQKLEAGVRTLDGPVEVAGAIAPMLRYVLGIEPMRAGDFEPEQLKRQISLAIRMLIERRLQQSPLMVIVEDLHWADAASVDLLCDIVDHFANRPLMVLVSHRSDMSALVTNRVAQSIIQLAPLVSDDIRTLVSELFGPVDGAEFTHVQSFVATRAGGNPLFAEEIVRSLVTGGALVREGDRWTCVTAREAARIPPTLHGLLLSRVDRLTLGPRRLLQQAAVLGMEFDKALLLEIASDASDADVLLDHLIESGFIQKVGHGREPNRYRFTHALVHEVVYQNLLLSRRAELHERVGRALERAAGPHPGRLSDLEALGYHWSFAPDKARGARYLMAAGDWARGVYANDDAIRHYERALHTLADCQACHTEMQTVRERLADLLALTGRRTEALEHYETMRQAIETTADVADVARLHRKIGCLHWEAGDRAQASVCFTWGLERLGSDGNSIERAQLFQEIGRLAFRAGDNAAAIDWARKALGEAASEVGAALDGERVREAAATRAQACNTLGVALARTGSLGEAVDQIEQSIRLAEAHDLPQAACRGYANLGVLYSSLDPRRSIDTCLRGLETAKKIGDLGFQSRIYANLAVSYCALTDRCEAQGVEAARMAIDLDRRLGLLDHLAVPLIVLGQIYQCHGDHAMAFASFAEALDLAEKAGEPQLLFPCYDGLATLHLDTGNQALAEVYLAKSKDVCERAGIDPDALVVLPFLS
jgi:adenylate cyclase